MSFRARTVGFTLIGLGEPREVQPGVVGGTYFEVTGLNPYPVLGRLIGPEDDGPKAAGVVVLTHRFWTTTLKKDPFVIGKTVRLGSSGEDRSAIVIGVLEPPVPYPQDTEIIANVVTRGTADSLWVSRSASWPGSSLLNTAPQYCPADISAARNWAEGMTRGPMARRRE